jgi:transaldolase
MKENRLKKLTALGQSVWFDYIRRDLFTGGRLGQLIAEDGLRGMTSNPTIFQKAIAETELYDEQIRRSAREDRSPAAVFEALAVEDVRSAADVFRPVYAATGGDDGFVSIEVTPRLARDTAGSIAEARRLWTSCDRPNVMIKLPGTKEGLPAIRQCLIEGINVNITLLFSIERYREVMDAYLAAMEDRLAAGKPVAHIRSVASFFVSRVDTKADQQLDRLAAAADSEARRRLARELRGKLAIANARLAYQAFLEVFRGPRFAVLKARGAAVQRPLWASTSTKDPAYPELYYAEALAAPESVDTMPPETLEAYRAGGDPKVRIEDDLPAARATFDRLRELGVDAAQIARELEAEGVRKFSDSYDQVLRAIESKEHAMGLA